MQNRRDNFISGGVFYHWPYFLSFLGEINVLPKCINELETVMSVA